MRRFVVIVAIAAAAMSVTGCSGGDAVMMPDVVGKRLDVAISDVKRAGIEDEVDVVGGGLFGVLDKSNWTVCSQDPASGAPISKAPPRVTVERECDSESAASPEPPEDTAEPTPSSTESEEPLASPTETQAEQVLTVKNNKELAALMASTDPSGKAQKFAAKYEGRTIKFDGTISAMNNHGDYDTRYDILVTAGNSAEGTRGPNFQFRDVNLSYDLHLTGSNIPDTLGIGDKLGVTAQVTEYEEATDLFLIEPLSTRVR
jgi:Domain of unknown function (DUF4839)/PASTA domain